VTCRLLPGWRADADVILAALRTLYTYTDREPDRVTGWLYLPDRPPHTPWPEPFAALGPALLGDLETATGTRFDAACFQAYRDGAGVDWHHDRDWGAQAILSLGVTRSFGLRHANGSGHEETLRLAHGDLLYMPPGFQDSWEHCVPVEDAPGERCSIVFRSPA
jgi:alkylated DNA repair dioxygenase AlkB